MEPRVARTVFEQHGVLVAEREDCAGKFPISGHRDSDFRMLP